MAQFKHTTGTYAVELTMQGELVEHFDLTMSEALAYGRLHPEALYRARFDGSAYGMWSVPMARAEFLAFIEAVAIQVGIRKGTHTVEDWNE